jgi:hypothetical protein
MRSLHDVHEMNAYIGLVLSVRMIQLDNHWTNLDEIWYGRSTIGYYSRTIHINILQLITGVGVAQSVW